MNLELIAGSGMFFAPMQVIEEDVGYDIALVPGHQAVWASLGLPNAPPGLATPLAYDSTGSPVPGHAFFASLFIQYKRPERMVRANAVEAPSRRAVGGGVPFFRVRLSPDQHAVLTELEARAGADAVVRYAAPLFHQIGDLWMRQATREVFEHSTFIAPSQAGTTPGCWTYDDGGAPIFCSEPMRGEAETSRSLISAVVVQARSAERRDWTAHLRILADNVARIDLTAPWRRRRIDEIERADVSGRRREEAMRVRPPLDRDEWRERLWAFVSDREVVELEAAVDAAVVANAAAAVGISWLLADIRPRNEAV